MPQTSEKVNLLFSKINIENRNLLRTTIKELKLTHNETIELFLILLHIDGLIDLKNKTFNPENKSRLLSLLGRTDNLGHGNKYLEAIKESEKNQIETKDSLRKITQNLEEILILALENESS